MQNNSLKISIEQINPTVGDISGNYEIMKECIKNAKNSNVDIIIMPELSLVGYPPEDLILKPYLLKKTDQLINELADILTDKDPAIIFGAPIKNLEGLYNAAVIIDNGSIKYILKHHLPSYGVFDEERIFVPGDLPEPVMVRGLKMGLMICEDMWFSDISEKLKKTGADFLVSINGSPYDLNKPYARLTNAIKRVKETHLPLLFINQVGGQDELVFDGASFILSNKGELLGQLSSWNKDSRVIKINNNEGKVEIEKSSIDHQPTNEESIWRAVCCGLRDYVNKNQFKGVVIGLSGGIDSAVTAAIAFDALGSDRVHGIRMPSKISSKGSLDDAELTGKLLSIKVDTIPIESSVNLFENIFKKYFVNLEKDVTEENIQSRIRGLILMAFSNKFKSLLLTTGNKSELSIGYATLYGDMNGGFSVLKDVYKTEVYKLAEWRNINFSNGLLGPNKNVIPKQSIIKPPSAELRPGQVDQDSLPDYEILDEVLKQLIEKEKSSSEIISLGFESCLVKMISRLLYLAEYKRRQSCPGVKITSRAFGRDRRYPITNSFYREEE